MSRTNNRTNKKAGRPAIHHFTAEELNSHRSEIPECPHLASKYYGALEHAARHLMKPSSGLTPEQVVEKIREESLEYKPTKLEEEMLHEYLEDKNAVVVALMKKYTEPVDELFEEAHLTDLQFAICDEYKKDRNRDSLEQWLRALKYMQADIHLMLKRAEIYNETIYRRDDRIREALGTKVIEENEAAIRSPPKKIGRPNVELSLVHHAAAVPQAAAAAPVMPFYIHDLSVLLDNYENVC